jgi:hypothetical protein
LKGIKGEVGPSGPSGKSGPRGNPGVPGYTFRYPGIPGTPGQKGEKGEGGEAGSSGPPGKIGPKGSPGNSISGQTGKKGEAGLKGIKGEVGPSGPSGKLGPKGDKGVPGHTFRYPGIPGTPGQKGEKGEHGLKGEVGPSGTRGNVGANGKPGAPGRDIRGIPGRQGQKGDKGSNGIDGHTGPRGPKGERGLPSARGPPGQRGPPGPPGIPRLISRGTPDVCSKLSEGLMRYNKMWKGVEYCDGSDWLILRGVLTLLGSSPDLPATSCGEIAKNYRSSSRNGQYWIKPSSNEPSFQAYCDAVEGWTLIMKIDGRKNTFNYDSAYWSNKEEFQSNSLELDNTEAKLASYWTLPFTELRLGMKESGITRWIIIKYRGLSVFTLIADGQYRRTTVGKNTWRALLKGSSVQNNCNKEGFNVKGSSSSQPRHSRVRLGVISNNQDHCNSPDSLIGFGAYDSETAISVGNFGDDSSDNGRIQKPAMGYILAR